MEAVPGFRAFYQCSCGAYRWYSTAIQKGETKCLACGAPFAQAKVCYWPKPQKAGGGGGRARIQPSTGQLWTGGQWPQLGGWQWHGLAPKGSDTSKGGKGIKGKGNQMGPWGGKGPPQPQQAGLLTASSTGTGHRRPAGTAQAPTSGINYNRASKDGLYRARMHYDVVRGLWGEDHEHTLTAKKQLEEAEKEALEKQPPAKKLASLRQEFNRALDDLQRGLQRSDQLELEIGQLQQEYYSVDSEVERTARKIQDLQVEIAAHEEELPQAVRPGAQPQRGLRDQLQDLLSAHVQRGGKPLSDQQQERACENLEKLLKDFEVDSGDGDANMDGSDLSSLPPLSEASDVEERQPKQRRAKEKDSKDQDAAEEAQEDWQQGLGAIGKKLVRRGLLAKSTVQKLAERHPGEGGGKAKGKGKTGKGKGKHISFSAAVQAHPPKAASPPYAQEAAPDQASSPSATGLPGAAVPPGGVPEGGSLTGGWPQLHPQGSSSAQGVRPAPLVDAASYIAAQAQLRRGEGQT